MIKEALQEKPVEIKRVPILGLPTSPSPREVMPGRTNIPFQSTVRIGMQEIKDDIAAPAESSAASEQVQETNGKTGQDDYIAQAMHELILASGWSPTRTTPEKDYYFFTYLPPEQKRMWMQARVYISKLNLTKSLRIEGLTIPTGMEGRLIVIIRTQKSGGIDRLANSKTITQSLDTHNYFNQKGQLVNPDGLRAVLSSYLKQAEIL